MGKDRCNLTSVIGNDLQAEAAPLVTLEQKLENMDQGFRKINMGSIPRRVNFHLKRNI